MNLGNKGMLYAIPLIVILISLSIVVSMNIAFAQGNETVNPCAGVTCSTPPADTCADPNKARKYSSPGTCANGVCTYSYLDSDCPAQTTTCPDGYVSSCKGTCSAGVCSPCTPDCSGHQATATTNVTQVCNNNVREGTEQCDGGDLAGQTCQSRGFAGGTLKCNMGCTFDTSGCIATAAVCGNGVCESGETSTSCPSDCQTQVCAQIITYAVDAAGHCQQFPNSCLSPGWTAVASCPATNVTQPCPSISTPIPDWCRDGKIVPKYDNNGCVVSYDCQKITNVCPLYTEPLCKDGYIVGGGIDANGCKMPATCCGDRICSGKENAQNCVSDCAGGGAINCANVVVCISGDGCCPSGCSSAQDNDCSQQQPSGQRCPDGSTVKCGLKGDVYMCDPCPILQQNIQQGCHQESDPATGIVRMICNQICPEQQEVIDAQMSAAKQKCAANNGNPIQRVDGRGCNYINCQFSTTGPTSPIPISPVYCPSPSQIDDMVAKCKSIGIEPLFSFENGCKVVKCGEQQPVGCGLMPGPERERIEAECAAKGLGTIKEFDSSGCQVIRCGSQGECQKDPPQEAFSKCREQGGEMVVKRDPNGCAFSQCIMRGDERNSYVEDITQMPDSTELLSIAFKLEELKMDLDKLSQKTDDIANYYKSTGSPEEQRFRRVSDMFGAAKNKVDEIKTKLRDKLQTLTKDDLMEIKSDVRYVKDVMLKDIVYVMLSNSDEVKAMIQQPTATEAVSGSDCGSDGACFGRAFSVCSPVKFRPTQPPPGQQSAPQGGVPDIYIIGIEGNACVVKIVLPEGAGPPPGVVPGISPPYEMKCKFTDYALGPQNFREDTLPKYCEGNLLQLMSMSPSRSGGGSSQQYQQQPQPYQQPNQPTQPMQPVSIGTGSEELVVSGVCSNSMDCLKQCPASVENAKKCLDAFAVYSSQGKSIVLFVTTTLQDIAAGKMKPDPNVFLSTMQAHETQPAPIGPTQPAQPVQPAQPISTTPTAGPCSGCLNNGICDVGECSDCPDCYGKG